MFSSDLLVGTDNDSTQESFLLDLNVITRYSGWLNPSPALDNVSPANKASVDE